MQEFTEIKQIFLKMFLHFLFAPLPLSTPPSRSIQLHGPTCEIQLVSLQVKQILLCAERVTS